MCTRLHYRVVKETLYLEEVGYYESYGLSIVDDNGIELKHISDISTKAPIVENLADMCERHQVPLILIYDVIEDAIF